MEDVHQMYSFGFRGGSRGRRFSLTSPPFREIRQGARFITYAHLALQATLSTYCTLLGLSYADPITNLLYTSSIECRDEQSKV